MPLKQDGKSSIVDYRGLEKCIAALASKVSGRVDMVFLEHAYAGGIGCYERVQLRGGFCDAELVVELWTLPVATLSLQKWTKVIRKEYQRAPNLKQKRYNCQQRFFPKEFRMVPVI